MKRKFLALLCIVALVLSLASCDLFGKKEETPDTNEECEHTYDAEWSSNSTEHWHAATCDHAELKSGVAKHEDADEDGRCDVCPYEVGHVHTFEENWTSNDTHHWKVATCSHTNEKSELAAHVDSNSDGSCDACSKHVHVLNIFGKCTVCGKDVVAVDFTNINTVLGIVLGNGGKVVGGEIDYENVIVDVNRTTNEETGETEYSNSQILSKEKVTYLLGNDAAYYNVLSTADYGFGEYTSTQEKWYERLDEQTVFGVFQSSFDGEVTDYEVDGGASVDSLVGYYFAVSTLADAYGAENLLSVLYNLSQSSAANNYKFTADADTLTYTFSFNYLDINKDTAEGEGDHVDYYEVEVSFSATTGGMLKTLDVECKCYTNSLDSDEDNDYTYDQNAGTITMNAWAAADTYTFKITQDEGLRSYVSEHPKSSFVPESFDAFLDEESTTALGESVTVTEGETLHVYFGNYVPTTAGVQYVAETFSATENENVFVFFYGNVVSVYSAVVGSHEVSFSVGGKTFTFTLVVEERVVDVEEQPENSVAVTITNADTYAWSAVASFTAPQDGDYTFYIPVGYGAWDKAACDNNFSGSPYVDFYDPYGGTFTVSVKEGETYEFYVSSVNAGLVYITYTVDDYTGSDDEGEDDDTVATEVVGGSYLGSNPYRGECTLVIDTANGTVTMNGQEFTYTFDSGVMTLYLNGNAMPDYMLGVTLGADGVPTAFVNNGNSYTVLANAGGDDGEDDGDDTVETVTEGTYVGTDWYGNSPLTVTVEGNTVTFTYNHPMMGPSSLVATYAFVDGELVLYGEDGSELHPLAGSLSVDANGTPVSAGYNGNDYTLSAGGSSDDGDEDENVAGALTGYYAMEGYEVIIYEDLEVAGKYIFNAYNNNGDVYYTLTAVDNGDGSYTLTLTLENPEEDVFGFLYEEFTVYVDGDYKTMAGPAFEVEIPDYEDITLGTHTVTLTTEMIENGYLYFDFVVEAEAFYNVSGLSAIFFDAYGDYYGSGLTFLYEGNYVLALSVWDAAEGDVEFTFSASTYSELTAEEIIGAVSASGDFYLGNLIYGIYGGEYYDGVYFVNIYTDDWMTDVYYVVTELVKNEDGSISFVLALNTEMSETDDFGFAGTTITVAYYGYFELTHDKPLTVTQGTFVGTDMYGNAFLTIVVDATTVTFNFEHPMFGPSSNVATYAIVDGAVVLYDELGNVLNPLAGSLTIDENGLPVAASFNGNSYTLVASGAEDDNDGGLQLGENFVDVLDGWMGTEYTFTAPEAGTYNFHPGYGSMIGYDFYAYAFGETITVYLEAGQTIVLTALTEDRSTGEICIYIELGSGDIGGDVNTEPDGSADHPYIIEELPLEITIVGYHDVYYNFVATEDCTLTITYTSGTYVSGLVSFDKDSTNCVYTVYCSAGDVIEINLWTSSPMENTYTYTISYAA